MKDESGTTARAQLSLRLRLPLNDGKTSPRRLEVSSDLLPERRRGATYQGQQPTLKSELGGNPPSPCHPHLCLLQL